MTSFDPMLGQVKGFLGRALELSPQEWSRLNPRSEGPSRLSFQSKAEDVGLSALYEYVVDWAGLVACKDHIEETQCAASALLLRDHLTATEFAAAYAPFDVEIAASILDGDG